MSPYVLLLYVAIAILVLVILLARLRAKSRERRIRKALGLPPNSNLGQFQQAIRAFENTDMKLSEMFPHLSAKERAAMARKLLREKGVLPPKPDKRSAPEKV